MKKLSLVLLALMMALVFVSCASAPDEKKDDVVVEPVLRRPEILDHKNYQWGKDVPDWVVQDVNDLEALDEFQDVYLFKLESPRGKSLEGLKIWTEDFEASSEIVKMIDLRVRSKFSGAAVGDLDAIEAYMEKVVSYIAEARISGVKKEGDYWVQRRYYTAEGDVDEDAYQYIYLYSIAKDVLDTQIQNALDGTEVEPETKVRAKDLVQEAFNGME